MTNEKNTSKTTEKKKDQRGSFNYPMRQPQFTMKLEFLTPVKAPIRFDNVMTLCCRFPTGYCGGIYGSVNFFS